MTRIVLGEESKTKLLQIPLSNDTVQRRIADLSDNIKEQVIAEIKNLQLGLFIHSFIHSFSVFILDHY